jgi:hypothetical protein
VTAKTSRLIEAARRRSMIRYDERRAELEIAAAEARADGQHPITWRRLLRSAEMLRRAYEAERVNPEPRIPMSIRRVDP